MDHEIEVIHQNPLGLGVTFHVLGRDARFFQLLHDGIRYGLGVARRGSAANQEKVRKGADTLQVQKVQVHGLAVLGGADRLPHEWRHHRVPALSGSQPAVGLPPTHVASLDSCFGNSLFIGVGKGPAYRHLPLLSARTNPP